MKRTIIAALLLALALSVPASAAQIVQTGVLPSTLASDQTDWEDSVFFNQFDTSLGALNFVRLDVVGRVTGSGSFENLENKVKTATLTLSSTLNLYRVQGASQIFLTSVTASDSKTLTAFAYDGSTDGFGVDYVNWDGFSGVASDTVFPAPNGVWKGLGQIEFYGYGTGLSTASGAGNIQTTFFNYSNADITLTYDYDPGRKDVPEWGSLALASMAGFVGLPLFRRSRKQ